MKSGYIYVLTHPSDPNLYKIGVTTRNPKVRLAQHNSDPTQLTGRIVKETGHKWELKEFHEVEDPYWAENAFWSATPFADMPFRGGVEVETMTWEQVQLGIESAKKAGIRAKQGSMPDHIYAYTSCLRRSLQGRGITFSGYVKSIVSGRNNFSCANGHQWRTRAQEVIRGKGCPECGLGEMTSQDVMQMMGAGVICLLIHPEKLGFINVGVAYKSIDEIFGKQFFHPWLIHRYRNIDDVALAESLIWELLGKPLPHNKDPIEIDLNVAEDAFRKLIYSMTEEIAFEERRLESLGRRE